MQESIQKALEVLRAGGIILYPTDTVWGLGCDATNPEAVAKIYEIKRRADSKSLVLLASDIDMIARYVKEIPEMAIQLIDVNDKPMTIIYPDAVVGFSPDASGALPKPDRRALAFNTVAEDGTVGIRIPMMDFCQQLVFKLGRPLVSTSANISGEPTPLKGLKDVAKEIIDGVDFVVNPRFQGKPTCQPSSIIAFGERGEVNIIRK
jgi:L-threonylcarbamoyladenylate synthase